MDNEISQVRCGDEVFAVQILTSHPQIQKLASFIGSTECTALFKELSYRNINPRAFPEYRSGNPSLVFVRRYGGGQWVTCASSEAENGNPMSLPVTFDLVGVLTDPTFCNPSDLSSMREFSGTAILKSSCMEYRQLLKGCRQLWVNTRYVEESAKDDVRKGDALFKGVDPILSFGSLQTVRTPPLGPHVIHQ